MTYYTNCPRSKEISSVGDLYNFFKNSIVSQEYVSSKLGQSVYNAYFYLNLHVY